MRQVLVGILGLALGLGSGAAGVVLAPVLDGRWQTVDPARGTTLVDRLMPNEPTPLLFVPDSVTRDPARAATLVVVRPGLGGVGRDLAQEFVAAAEADRWLLLAPNPDDDPKDANESLQGADRRVDNQIVALVDQVMARPSLPVAPAIDIIGFSRGAQSAHRFALRHPDRVGALASFAAGTDTMPTSLQPYPLGIGNVDCGTTCTPSTRRRSNTSTCSSVSGPRTRTRPMSCVRGTAWAAPPGSSVVRASQRRSSS